MRGRFPSLVGSRGTFLYAIPYDTAVEIQPTLIEQKPVSGGWIIFIGAWLACCAAGIAAAVFLGQVFLGIVIIAAPTAVGVVASPTFALCCIALVLPLSGSVNFEGFLTADRVVGGLAAVGILFHCKFLGRGLSIRGAPIKPMLIFAMWAVLSGVWAPNHQYAFVASLTLVQLCIWAIAVWNAVAYGGNYFWPIRCYVVGMFIVVMRLYLTGGLARIARVSGSAARLTIGGTNDQNVNPNDFATFLAAGFLLSIYLFMRDPAKSLRLIWAGCSFVFPMMILLTGARSCMVGLAAGMIATALMLHNLFKSRAMLIGLVIAVLFIGVGVRMVLQSQYGRTEAVNRVFDAEARGRSVGNRIALMQQGLRNILKRPILGTGYKNYTIASDSRVVIHNDMMLIAAELGIFGACLFAFFYWKLLVASVRTRMPPEKWLLRSVALFFLTTGLAHPVLSNKSTWFFCTLAAAVAFRARELESAQQLDQYAQSLPVQFDPVTGRWGPAFGARQSFG